jgi:K+/H+ antiporter YhaU regulatory subunit KhtT
MEKKVLNKKELLEKDQREVDVFKDIIDKRTLIEEKFNQVNVKLNKLKEEADKLFGPKK